MIADWYGLSDGATGVPVVCTSECTQGSGIGTSWSYALTGRSAEPLSVYYEGSILNSVNNTSYTI